MSLIQMKHSDLKSWYQKHHKQILSDFFTFLRFRGISTDPKYREEIQKTARWLKEYLSAMGMEVQVWETAHDPVVFASYLKAGPKRPTVLFYHHFDVQPVDPIEEWKSDPFEPVVRGKRVYARGASDDKGQCFYSIAAIKAFLELCEKCDVNIKIFIEGEEESGSAGAKEVMEKKKEALKADYLLVVDVSIPAKERPAVTLGVRGIVAMEVSVTNAAVDMHSGNYGGVVLNPNRVLVLLLSQLWDKEGRVAVPGFYDTVKALSQEELKAFDQKMEKMESFGVRVMQREGDYSAWELKSVRPTIEINGISGGYTGEGFKTVIPSVAKAKISCRLVPDQDPEEIGRKVAAFLKERVVKGIDLQVSWDHGGKPVRSSVHAKIAEIALQAYTEVFGVPCHFTLSGGSIPIAADLLEASGASLIFMGTALSEDNIHAPNESFDLDQFEKGFLVIGQILEKLQRLDWMKPQ